MLIFGIKIYCLSGVPARDKATCTAHGKNYAFITPVRMFVVGKRDPDGILLPFKRY